MASLSSANPLMHLRSCSEPWSVLRGRTPVWSDAEAHRARYQDAPEHYALCALMPGVQRAQRQRVLFVLLSTSRKGMDGALRVRLDRVLEQLLEVLDVDAVLEVFIGLRRSRANHKHTTRAMVRTLLEHPRAEILAALRGPTVRDALEHAVGRNTLRGWEASGWTCTSGIRKQLLRHVSELERAQRIVSHHLYHGGVLERRGDYRAEGVVKADAEVRAPKTVTATNRGDISATLVHLYRGGASAELEAGLERYVKAAAARCSRFSGRVGVVLDASASTRGYGEREYCGIAQSVALLRMIEACASEVIVSTAGGHTEAGRIAPSGATDLAMALLDVLERDVDVAVVISDGYENRTHGDLARVIEALPGAGVSTPVAFCHSKFTHKDDLRLRRPVQGTLELEMWHEQEFAGVLATLFASAKGEAGLRYLRGQLGSEEVRS